MAKLVRILSPRDGKRRLVSKRMADVLTRRGWMREGDEETAPAPAPGGQYRTRHMEAGPIDRDGPDALSEAGYLHPGYPAPDPLGGVAFVSSPAREAAREAGLTAAAFVGRTGTGRGGTFTKPDVLEIIGAGA